jgi:hypothetical protein
MIVFDSTVDWLKRSIERAIDQKRSTADCLDYERLEAIYAM